MNIYKLGKLVGATRLLACVLASFGVFSQVALSQQIILRPATTQAALGESVLIDVVVNVPTGSISGVSAAISLPSGLSIVGTPSRSWYVEKWRDASIVPNVKDNVIYLAAAIKGTDAPCAGECLIARFSVTASTNRSFTLPFVTSDTIAMTAETTEVPFATFSPVTIAFGTSQAIPGDLNGNGEISATEMGSVIGAFLRQDSGDPIADAMCANLGLGSSCEITTTLVGNIISTFLKN